MESVSAERVGRQIDWTPGGGDQRRVDRVNKGPAGASIFGLLGNHLQDLGEQNLRNGDLRHLEGDIARTANSLWACLHDERSVSR
jgi:hypothetical protein